MMSFPRSIQFPLTKLVLVVILLALVGFGAIPSYLSGQWRWMAFPPVTALAELKAIRQAGITVPNWSTLGQETVQIGEHKWSKQLIKQGNDQATLLLFTQNGPKDQPQVEWLDIDGAQNWKTDSNQSIALAGNPASHVTARWFRGWTKRQTYAVLQWYAWPHAGHGAPYRWFLADRLAQWHHQRAPWVAVSILWPIEPLDDLEKYRSQVENLGQSVQAALLARISLP